MRKRRLRLRILTLAAVIAAFGALSVPQAHADCVSTTAGMACADIDGSTPRTCPYDTIASFENHSNVGDGVLVCVKDPPR